MSAARRKPPRSDSGRSRIARAAMACGLVLWLGGCGFSSEIIKGAQGKEFRVHTQPSWTTSFIPGDRTPVQRAVVLHVLSHPATGLGADAARLAGPVTRMLAEDGSGPIFVSLEKDAAGGDSPMLRIQVAAFRELGLLRLYITDLSGASMLALPTAFNFDVSAVPDVWSRPTDRRSLEEIAPYVRWLEDDE